MVKKAPNPEYVAIGQRLAQARKEAGYVSQTHFSATHGIKQSTYSMHEKGTRGMSVAAARQYAKLLGISADWLLLGGSEGPTGNDTVATYPDMDAEGSKVTTGKIATQTVGKIRNKRNLASTAPDATLRSGSSTVLFSYDNQIPVYGPMKGMGDRIDHSRPVAYIPRTMQLIGIENVRAFLVTHDTVTPLLKRGDTVVINPAKPLAIGRPAVLLDHDHRIAVGVVVDLSESAIWLQSDPRETPVQWLLANLDGAYHVVMTLAP